MTKPKKVLKIKRAWAVIDSRDGSFAVHQGIYLIYVRKKSADAARRRGEHVKGVAFVHKVREEVKG